MKWKNRTLAILLTFVMAVGMLPMTSLAADGDAEVTVIPVQDEAGFVDAINDINSKSGEFVIKLTDDITFSGKNSDDILFEKNTVTLLGEGHKLTSWNFSLRGDSIINLGAEGYNGTLQLDSLNDTECIFDIDDNATLNIYDGVTIGPSRAGGQAGGIQARGTSEINMYGGTIDNCDNWASVTGGVLLVEAACFNLYGGTIKNCDGWQGGAVGLGNTDPIAGDAPELWKPSFYMYGGTIENCTDEWLGGGAVCMYTSVESVFVMEGGTITGCTSTDGRGYGGAIFVFSTDEASKVELNGGQIYGNTGKLGGAVFNYAGSVVISDKVSIYNNSATAAGDDIYNNGNRSQITIGKVDSSHSLACGHSIDGWYYDDEGSRWNYADCLDEESDNYLELFSDTGTMTTASLALKAAHGEPPRYRVAYDLAGGTGAAGVDYSAEFVEEDTPIEVKAAPSKSGYTFEGWSDGITTYQPGDHIEVSTNIVLTAQWESLPTYTVTYDLAGGTGAAGVDYSAETVPQDTSVKVKAAPTRTGYTFEGWSDGTTIYQPGADLVVSGNITLTAQWKSTGGSGGGGSVTTYYTLKYESNGGTEYKDERYSRNTVVDLDKVPSREGYAFTGWYADKALTTQISEIKMTSNKTVYAGWRQSTVPDMLNGADHFAYVVGYPNGNVGPTDNITRAEVATIFFRLLNEDVRDANLTKANSFSDVPEGSWFNTTVSTMEHLGIIKGRAPGLFAPEAEITRAEFAAICARFDTSVENGNSNFPDISGHWAEAEIQRAATLGWIQGLPDGTFQPDRYITRAEAMTMINRVLCRIPEKESDLLSGMRVWPDNQPGDWYYLAIQEATNSHTFEAKGEIYEHWLTLTDEPDWSKYQ